MTWENIIRKDVKPWSFQEQDYAGMELMHETKLVKLLVESDIDPNTFKEWLESEQFDGFMERFSEMYVKKHGTDAIPDER